MDVYPYIIVCFELLKISDVEFYFVMCLVQIWVSWKVEGVEILVSYKWYMISMLQMNEHIEEMQIL